MAQTNPLPNPQRSAYASNSSPDTSADKSGALFILIAAACFMPFVAALVMGAAQ